MRTLRASEIGTYLFCQRAWWYASTGVESENQTEMALGSEIHTHHGRQVLSVGCLQVLGIVFLLLALALSIAFWMGGLI